MAGGSLYVAKQLAAEDAPGHPPSPDPPSPGNLPWCICNIYCHQYGYRTREYMLEDNVSNHIEHSTMSA